jgi:DNA-binding XRE family transcriptional regulator
LPFYRWQLVADKPILGYPDKLELVGHHLLKRRLDLAVTITDAAKALATHPTGLVNWEKGRTEIEVRFYPAIIRFLGYNPLPVGTTRGQRIQRERMTRGWSRKRLARTAEVDEASVRRLEEDTPRLARRPVMAICRALGVTL